MALLPGDRVHDEQGYYKISVGSRSASAAVRSVISETPRGSM